MLGNDVVDLRDAESRPESFRSRFDERVFTPEERRAISRDSDSLARRWALWAAKEAAYKLGKQVDRELVFAPGRMRVEFEPADGPKSRKPVARSGRVERLEGRGLAPKCVEVRSIETDAYVHVIAAPFGADWDAIDQAVESLEMTSTDASASVRRLAIREIARSLGIDAHRLAVGRRGAAGSGWQGGPLRSAPVGPAPSRVPTIELDGVETSLSLSLSHHGRFIAFAMTPRVEPVIHDRRRRESAPSIARAGATQP